MLTGKPNIQKLRETRDLDALLQALAHAEADVRQGAATALAQMGEARAAVPLCVLLGDGEPGVRTMARLALLRIGAPAVGALCAAAARQPAAGEVLAKMGAPAVPALADALRADDAGVRDAAAAALEQIGVPPDPSVQAGYAVQRQEWARAVSLGAAAAEPLCRAMARGDGAARQGAAAALLKIGVAAAGPVCAALGAEDPAARALAADILGRWGDTRAVGPLRPALADPDPRVCQAAAAALARLGQAGLPAVQAWSLVANQDWDAARALGEAAVAPLCRALAGADVEGRVRAAGVLGEIGGTRSVAPLVAALKDPDEQVQKAAAEALDLVGLPDDPGVRTLHALAKGDELPIDSTSVEAMVAALRSPDRRAREAAQALAKRRTGNFTNATTLFVACVALVQSGDARGREAFAHAFSWALLPDASTSQADVIQALARIGAPTVPLLCWLLKESCRIMPEVDAHYRDHRHLSNTYNTLGLHRANGAPVRKTAAEALRALYHGGQLDAAAKQAILEVRSLMAEPHRDGGDHRSTTKDCGTHLDWWESHTDQGVGVKL